MCRLNKIENMTIEFSQNCKREKKGQLGQFFTPLDISMFMASLININKENIYILDPGAGSGILTCSLLELLLRDNLVQKVTVDLFEIDLEVRKLLDENLKQYKELFLLNNKKLDYLIINDDFIEYNYETWFKDDYCGKYDVIISNPPYKKITRNSNLNKKLLHNHPNMYSLFMAISIKLLKNNGEFVFITPRSYFSGAYFVNFRKWLTSKVDIQRIHLFHSRKNIFSKEKVLQETVILKGIRNDLQRKYIQISESIDSIKINNLNIIEVEKKVVIDKTKNHFIKVPVCEKEHAILKLVEKWESSVSSSGYRLSTGKIVDFRCTKDLVNDIDLAENNCPVIWDTNLKSGKFVWPKIYKKKYQIIKKSEESNKLLLPNSNYLLIKRFSTKEEKRRLQVVAYFRNFLKTNMIGIENHVNYMRKESGELSKVELLGLFVLFNSNIMDKYYRTLSGNTQVNANEINSLKFPKSSQIKEIGLISKKFAFLSSDKCDEIINDYFNINQSSVKFRKEK